jgi:hypothetical protein
MTTPGDMLDALEELNLKEVVLEAIEDHKEEYVKLNLEQLYQGLNPQGEKITPEYAPTYYRKKKARMNPTPGEGTPDFKLSGDSYEETHAEVDQDEIEIKTETEYFKYNEERWGDAEIWGLDPDNHQEFVQEILQPLIVEKVSELTGLK